jgi:hypothetical protein
MKSNGAESKLKKVTSRDTADSERICVQNRSGTIQHFTLDIEKANPGFKYEIEGTEKKFDCIFNLLKHYEKRPVSNIIDGIGQCIEFKATNNSLYRPLARFQHCPAQSSDTDTQTDSQTDTHTDTHTDTQTDSQTDMSRQSTQSDGIDFHQTPTIPQTSDSVRPSRHSLRSDNIDFHQCSLTRPSQLSLRSGDITVRRTLTRQSQHSLGETINHQTVTRHSLRSSLSGDTTIQLTMTLSSQNSSQRDIDFYQTLMVSSQRSFQSHGDDTESQHPTGSSQQSYKVQGLHHMKAVSCFEYVLYGQGYKGNVGGMKKSRDGRVIHMHYTIPTSRYLHVHASQIPIKILICNCAVYY